MLYLSSGHSSAYRVVELYTSPSRPLRSNTPDDMDNSATCTDSQHYKSASILGQLKAERHLSERSVCGSGDEVQLVPFSHDVGARRGEYSRTHGTKQGF